MPLRRIPGETTRRNAVRKRRSTRRRPRKAGEKCRSGNLYSFSLTLILPPPLPYHKPHPTLLHTIILPLVSYPTPTPLSSTPPASLTSAISCPTPPQGCTNTPSRINTTLSRPRQIEEGHPIMESIMKTHTNKNTN